MSIATAQVTDIALAGHCCTNRPGDSLCESSMIAGGREQLVTHEVQDEELAVV